MKAIMRKVPSLAVVVPCYNEEEILPTTINVLVELLNDLVRRNKVDSCSKIYFIDDGSTDNTWHILESQAHSSPCLVALRLSCNKGHQNALYAGLCYTQEEAIVSIDADLQDDPSIIELMVDKYLEGSDVVFGVRNNRKTDSLFKRFTAEFFYYLMQKMGVDLVFNHADFRLMSRRALDALKEYPESNLFLRGIVREIGFSSSIVEYERKVRSAGKSKYPLKRMLSFAWDGVTSFSIAPLRAITFVGVCSSVLSLSVLIWALYVRVFTDDAIPGWASILLPLLFVGSVQLVSLGVIGEYLGKLYKEIKRRPKYHVCTIEEYGKKKSSQ